MAATRDHNGGKNVTRERMTLRHYLVCSLERDLIWQRPMGLLSQCLRHARLLKKVDRPMWIEAPGKPATQ
jgi:hypothetical protein